MRNRKFIARTRYIIQFSVLPDGNKACQSSGTGLVRLLCGGYGSRGIVSVTNVISITDINNVGGHTRAVSSHQLTSLYGP